MTTTETEARPMSVDHARALAADLIDLLADAAGDTAEVNRVMGHWNDRLGPSIFGLVAMATVQRIFTDCIKTIPAGPGDQGFDREGGTDDD